MSMVPINQTMTVAPPTPLEIIAKAASDPNTDPQKLALLWELWERTKRADAEKAFNQAMSAAQEEMRPVLRDAKNPNTSSRFARLESIDNAVRPIYTKHGFSLSFNSGEPRSATGVRILCDVRHTEGFVKAYELEGELDNIGLKGSPTKTAIHGLGSSVSYLRRYLTCMIFNITLTNEDDDGNAANGRGQHEPEHGGWEGSGSVAAARAMATTRIAELTAGKPPTVQEPPLVPTLEASIEQAEEKKPKGHGPSPKYSQRLKAFKAVKKEIPEAEYYRCLGEAGYEHCNQFPDTARGVQAMDICLADMREIRDMPEVK